MGFKKSLLTIAAIGFLATNTLAENSEIKTNGFYLGRAAIKEEYKGDDFFKHNFIECYDPSNVSAIIITRFNEEGDIILGKTFHVSKSLKNKKNKSLIDNVLRKLTDEKKFELFETEPFAFLKFPEYILYEKNEFDGNYDSIRSKKLEDRSPQNYTEKSCDILTRLLSKEKIFPRVPKFST